MRLNGARAKLFGAGMAVILTANAIALIGVAYNRGGDPESQLQLTERELQSPYRHWLNHDNSGITLTLRWRVIDKEPDASNAGYYYAYSRGTPLWMDVAKLRELGFKTTPPADSQQAYRYVTRQQTREVFLVLEFDGPAYQTALSHARQRLKNETDLAAANAGKKEFQDRAERGKRELYQEERVHSRLFIVDAGLDASALRARYPDRQRYAITRGHVRPSLFENKGQRLLTGYITHLSVGSIYVSYDHRRIFEQLLQADQRSSGAESEPRYTTILRFGRRFEPWLVDAATINK